VRAADVIIAFFLPFKSNFGRVIRFPRGSAFSIYPTSLFGVWAYFHEGKSPPRFPFLSSLSLFFPPLWWGAEMVARAADICHRPFLFPFSPFKSKVFVEDSLSKAEVAQLVWLGCGFALTRGRVLLVFPSFLLLSLFFSSSLSA